MIAEENIPDGWLYATCCWPDRTCTKCGKGKLKEGWRPENEPTVFLCDKCGPDLVKRKKREFPKDDVPLPVGPVLGKRKPGRPAGSKNLVKRK